MASFVDKSRLGYMDTGIGGMLRLGKPDGERCNFFDYFLRNRDGALGPADNDMRSGMTGDMKPQVLRLGKPSR